MCSLLLAYKFKSSLHAITSLSLSSIRGVISDTITVIPGNLPCIQLIIVKSLLQTFKPLISSISLTPVWIIIYFRDVIFVSSMKSARADKSAQR